MASQFLETTVDKFVFKAKKGCWYSRDGIWVELDGDLARVGVTDFAQQTSGDVAFVELPAPGRTLRRGEPMGEIETIKVTADLTAPISGTVREVNPALEDNPERVNQDPYDEGWLALVEPSDWAGEKASLLDAEQYLELMRGQAEEELKKR